MEIEEILTEVDKKVINNEVFDKMPEQRNRPVKKARLSHYLRPRYVIKDNGSMFTVHFTMLCDLFGIECKSTAVRNPQANAIFEYLCGVLGNMFSTDGVEGENHCDHAVIELLIIDAASDVSSTYHTIMYSSPRAAVLQ